MNSYAWLHKRMVHSCPFCGNYYTFAPIILEERIHMKNDEGYSVHVITVRVACHGCGAAVEGQCCDKDIAIE